METNTGSDLQEPPPGLNIIAKPDWGAMEAIKTKTMVTPVEYVLLKYHSKTQTCVVPSQCRNFLRHLQQYQMKMLDYDDIEYNFYIAGDGNVYEGRGWTIEPYNEHGLVGGALYIAYMGDFDTSREPPDDMKQSYDELVKYGIEHNYIRPDFKFYELRLSHSLLRDYQPPKWRK